MTHLRLALGDNAFAAPGAASLRKASAAAAIAFTRCGARASIPTRSEVGAFLDRQGAKNCECRRFDRMKTDSGTCGLYQSAEALSERCWPTPVADRGLLPGNSPDSRTDRPDSLPGRAVGGDWMAIWSSVESNAYSVVAVSGLRSLVVSAEHTMPMAEGPIEFSGAIVQSAPQGRAQVPTGSSWKLAQPGLRRQNSPRCLARWMGAKQPRTQHPRPVEGRDL